MNFPLRISIVTLAALVFALSHARAADSARSASKKSVKILTGPSTKQEPSSSASEEVTALPPEQEPRPSTSTSNEYERRWMAAYDLSPIGLILPIKHGPSLAYRYDETWAFEVSYFGGSLSFPLFGLFDLGSIKEYHWLVNARRFRGGSFNWVFGLSRHSYEVRLGNEILSRITSSSIPTDILTVNLLGAQFGLGNQWTWENGFLFGVDWFVLEIPLATLEAEAPALDFVSNANDRKTIDDALGIMKRLPTGALFKIRLGYSF